MKSAAQALARWQAGVQAGAGNYTQGVQNSKDWAGAAAQAVPTMVQNLNAAAAAGRIERGIQNRGTAGWRAKTLAKANNYQQGVSQGAAAYQAGYTQKLLPMLEAGQAAIASTPRGSFAQNLQRMSAFVQAVHDTKQSMG